MFSPRSKSNPMLRKSPNRRSPSYHSYSADESDDSATRKSEQADPDDSGAFVDSTSTYTAPESSRTESLKSFVHEEKKVTTEDQLTSRPTTPNADSNAEDDQVIEDSNELAKLTNEDGARLLESVSELRKIRSLQSLELNLPSVRHNGLQTWPS